jgi:hypothetical protein
MLFFVGVKKRPTEAILYLTKKALFAKTCSGKLD